MEDVYRCGCALSYSLFYMLEDWGLVTPTDDVDLLCLHYIFLPRINRALQQYSEAYNHHPIRNWSPYQLWYHDDPIDLNDYGIDPQGPPTNGFDVELIEGPETAVSLSSTQMALVRLSVNNMEHCSETGKFLCQSDQHWKMEGEEKMHYLSLSILVNRQEILNSFCPIIIAL